MSHRPGAASPPHLQAGVTVVARPSRAPVVAGAGLLALAVAAFAGLVDAVSEHADLASYDPGITSSVAAFRLPGLNFAAQVASTVGSEAAVGVLTALTLVWMWFVRRDRPRAALLATTMVVGAAVTLGVKHLLSRHRPPASFVVGPVDNGYSFPSGHTLFSTVFLGLLVMLVVWPRAGRGGRAWALAAWVLGSLAIGASRVYLGYHWTTDVIAGWVLAVAVLAAALVALVTLLPRLETLRLWQLVSGTTNDDVEDAPHASPAR